MTTPTYSLAKDAYLCFTGPHYVVLDLKQDRYVCISRAEVDVLAPWLTGWHKTGAAPEAPMPSEVAASLKDLIDAGILVDKAQGSKQFRPLSIEPATSTIELNQINDVGALLRVSATFMAAAYDAHRRLKREPLESIVNRVRLRNLEGSLRRSADPGKFQLLVSKFNILRPFFPRDYLCMFDSLALSNFLASFGYFPHWVFGVQSDPFAAHCWLQDHNVVLNDSIHNVVPYTPVMVV